MRGVVADARRNPPIGGQLADAQHALCQLFAIDDQGQRAAQARVILERRLVEIETVVVGVELGRDVQLAGQIRPDPVELSPWNHVGRVQAAGAIARELRVLIRNQQVFHCIQACVQHRSSR